MKTLRLLAVALLAGAGLVILAPSPAMACSCVPAGTGQPVRWADAVFEATVTDVDEPPLRGLVSSTDPRTYHVEVQTVFEGEPADEVRSAMSGASCGLEGVSEGDRYVFFATTETDGLWTSLCSGTAPGTDRLVRRVEAVTGPGAASPDPSPAPNAGGGQLPGNLTGEHPPAQSAVPLALWLPAGVGLAGVVAVAVGWRIRRARTD